MKFQYASYEVDPTPILPSGVLYRPEALIEVFGRRTSLTIQALVDTGSDQTVLPKSVAEAIGVEIDFDSACRASAVGGYEVILFPGSVELKLSQGLESYRWKTTIAFLDGENVENEIALLGYSGFLEFFRATFDSEHQVLELVPNRKLQIAT